jgi:hypothetical protein
MAERKMQITADTDARRAHYSNLALISHRQEEFVIDFLFVDPQGQSPNEGRAILSSRVVLSPGHLKRLFQAVGENIQRYEKSFGKIALPPKIE